MPKHVYRIMLHTNLLPTLLLAEEGALGCVSVWLLLHYEYLLRVGSFSLSLSLSLCSLHVGFWAVLGQAFALHFKSLVGCAARGAYEA